MATTFLYNPDRKSKDELIAEFVVRTEIYDEIMYDLETSSMQHPEQHYLLVGQRGSGKTTLLNRLKYGIEDSKTLKDEVIPILFSEEQYNVSELVNLWENIGEYLEDHHGFGGLSKEIGSNSNKSDFEELSYDILEKHLRKTKKKLVLLIDNIGDILKKMEKTEVHRFREILQTKSEMRLIVSSPFYLETVLDYHQPFFEFFKVLRLDGLKQQETQSLLIKLAKSKDEEKKIKQIIAETPERIETLRTLTGGVPRTIALMFNIFVEYNDEDVVRDLEKILDAVTPLYKHRMDDLPTQQQKIVDAVAKNWDGISVKELKERLRIESKIISAQLRQLEKSQIIEKVETQTKNNIYFIKERFFNIWYLMRYGRKYNRQRVKWLVKFLESWCSSNEIELRIQDYIRKVKDGEQDQHFINFYGEVYAGIENVSPETKLVLKEYIPKYLSNQIVIEDEEIIRMVIGKLKDKAYEEAIDLLKQLRLFTEKNVEAAIEVLVKIMRDDPKLFEKQANELYIKLKRSLYVSFYWYVLMLMDVSARSLSFLNKNEYNNAHISLKLFLEVTKSSETEYEGPIINLVRIILNQYLISGQANVVLSVFESEEIWKDKLKPTYYATLKILGKEDELYRMGSEIKDQVDEIVQSIKEGKEQKKIAGN